MVTAIVLLTAKRDKVHPIAEALADINEITEVYSTAGRYDLAVIVRGENNESLEELITTRLLKVEGIVKSETLIAFRAYSRYDLERMFDMD
ncbi:MAG TPA: Lrp/AsnC family transcriptional regulator [Phycisphaerales bacterium]|nr:Lrp/AsnC family transcriptional regulator [Phycisphaerales bacterium]